MIKLADLSVAGKLKEREKIELKPMPTMGQYRAWRASTINTVNAASALSKDRAVGWLLQCEDMDIPDSTFAEYPHKDFESLDKKLAEALVRIAREELGRQFTQAADDAIRQKRVVRERT